VTPLTLEGIKFSLTIQLITNNLRLQYSRGPSDLVVIKNYDISGFQTDIWAYLELSVDEAAGLIKVVLF
jgi:hypothetical protein